jgi:hypothetical protein
LFLLQLQHLDPLGHLHLPYRFNWDLLLSHEHRPLVQTARWCHHASAQTSQEEETKGKKTVIGPQEIILNQPKLY